MDDVRHLAAFVAVADRLHIGDAAEQLGLTRDAVAGRLRALERRLNLVLVDRRHRRRIALTPDGDALLPLARAVLVAHGALDATALRARQGRHGVVRVAMVMTTAVHTPRPTPVPDDTSDGDDPSDGGGRRDGLGQPDDGDRPTDANRLDDGDRPDGFTTEELDAREPAESVPEQELRALGRTGGALADVLATVEDGWSVEYRRMGRHGAARAMEVGGIDCAIGRGPALRLGPGALDARPHQLERGRSITVRPVDAPPTTLTWRRSWGTAGAASEVAAALVRDRLVGTMLWLRQEAIDARYPRAAARRRELEERRRLAGERAARLADETRRYGRDIALRRAHEDERRETIARFEVARAAGTVTPNLLVAWACATTRPGAAAPLPTATFPDDSPFPDDAHPG